MSAAIEDRDAIDHPRPELPAERAVAVVRSAGKEYAAQAPFHPPESYTEFAKLPGQKKGDPANHVFAAVRESLRLLGLDRDHFGTADWNPLAGLVRPGDRVVVKPNWVSECHELNDSWEQIITHGSVLRAVIDYVQLALAGNGAISLADGPMLGSDFAEICRRTGAEAIRTHYASAPGAVPIELLDLRSMFFETQGQVVIRRHALPGDPRGAVAVNLAHKSALFGFKGEGRYYGADYDTDEVNRHHQGETQEYQLSGTAMNCDVIIDVPKLKSHHKVGVTMALKGVVGLNCGRNWLPHRTQGTPQQGGDQFASSGARQRLESRLVRMFERASLKFPRLAPQLYRVAKKAGKLVFGRTHQTIRGGGWHGNDTLWRMVHDINRCLLFADGAGRLHESPTRRRFVVIDGVVAGQGLGPVQADPIPCGVIIAGQSPLAVDIVGAELMGFDHTQIPMLVEALRPHPLPICSFAAQDIDIRSNVSGWGGNLAQLRAANPFRFAAPLGWIGHVERCAVSA
jgi:uncharacterized protein (DUF362 family)